MTVLICIGDSLTYGHDNAGGQPPLHGSQVPRSATPYPEALAALTGQIVLNRGYPGDTAAQGLRRWPTQAGQVILMYGTNEALRSNTLTLPLYIASHRLAMRQWLVRYPEALMVEPPPLRDPGAEQRLSRIRAVGCEVAGPRWVSTAPHLPVAWTDGVHLTAVAYEQLAALVAQHLS